MKAAADPPPADRRAPGATPEPDEPLFGNYFVSAYPPFPCWREDAVARVGDALGRPGSPDVPFGLYVHVPFCVERCDYCYYLAYDDRADVVERYLEALDRELALYVRRPAFGQRRPAFLYFGGGTPSSLSAARIARMFARLRARLDWSAVEEVSFECAPQTVTAEKAAVLRDVGVNRVSLGVQQLDDRVLRESGRIHRVADVEAAYARLRSAGFDTVNVDLMVGMVGETERSFREGLERVLAMGPDCITIYQLEIPTNTPLFRHLRGDAGAPRPAPWPVKRSRLSRAFARLEEAGFTPRSAYTAVRDPQRHRFVYQDAQYRGADVLGLGVSSFSYVGGTHFQNLARIDPYLRAVDRGDPPLSRAYPLDERERLVRELVLQLKLLRVDVDRLREKFGVDPLEVFAEPLRRLCGAGLLVVDDGEIALTREGVPRVDRMLAELYLPEHRPEDQPARPAS